MHKEFGVDAMAQPAILLYAWPSRLYGDGPCSVSPSPFGLDFGTLDFRSSDSGLTKIDRWTAER